MDIQVSSEEFKKFLKRCHCDGLVKDLIINAEKDRLVARFAGKTGNFYGEVYLPNVKVMEQGNISVQVLKKLMDVISRSDTDVLRIKSTDDVFLVTEGSGIGKMRSELLQSSDGEIIESFKPFKNYDKMFDVSELHYIIPDIKYSHGCNISLGMIGEILKDAKAFDFEVYTFKPVKTKKGTTLRCQIINQHTTEKIQRTIVDADFIGKADSIPEVMVGHGFKEMAKAMDGGVDKMIKMYFSENSILLTDESETFFYNLHTLSE